MGGRGGNSGPQRVKYPSGRSCTPWGAGSRLSWVATQPLGTQEALGVCWHSLSREPTSSPTLCQGLSEAATRKATLANGRAEFPAKLATLPGRIQVISGADQ